MDILYADNHLLALDKPTGLLTQPSGTSRDSLEAQGKAWIKETCNKPGAVFLEAVHRIDAVACGVVLFARTSKALSRLAEAIREGRCQKEYRILISGRLPAESGSLKHWMKHQSHFAEITAPHAPEARLATLQYEVLNTLPGGITLVKVLLESGRYHQIRAQFAHIGCPVVGDAKYGSKLAYQPEGIALQHYCLSIEHPVTHENLRFVSKLDLAKRPSK